VAGLVADGLPVPAGLADLLSRGVMNGMWWGDWKTPMLAGLAVGLLIAGAGLSGPHRAAAEPQSKAEPTPPGRAGVPAAKPGPAWRTRHALKHDAAVTAVAFAADLVAAGDAGGSLVLWNAQTGREREKLIDGSKADDKFPVDWLAFAPDAAWLFMVNGERHHLHACQLDPKDRLFPGFGGEDLRMFGFTPDGKSFLYTNGGKAVEFFGNTFPENRISGERQATIRHESEVAAVVVTADSDRAMTVTTDGTVRCWDLGNQNPKMVWSAKTEVANPTTVALAPDGGRVTVASGDGVVRLIDGKTGKSLAKLAGHAGAVPAAAFSPNGKTLATAGADKTARVWDAATGKELAVLTGHTDAVRAVAFGPDGKTLVTGSADKTARIWEIKE
jgi:WD40 repeat protein